MHQFCCVDVRGQDTRTKPTCADEDSQRATSGVDIRDHNLRSLEHMSCRLLPCAQIHLSVKCGVTDDTRKGCLASPMWCPLLNHTYHGIGAMMLQPCGVSNARRVASSCFCPFRCAIDLEFYRTVPVVIPVFAWSSVGVEAHTERSVCKCDSGSKLESTRSSFLR